MSSRGKTANSEKDERLRHIRNAEKPPKQEATNCLLTDKEVSALTGLDRGVTLYRLRISRKIGFYKFGKVIRYSPQHIREFLEQHEKEPKVRTG